MRHKGSSQQHNEKKIELELQPDNPQARKMMWGGVIVFLLAIILIWGWSVKVKINDLKLQETPEGSLIQKSKQEWKATFKEDIINVTTSTVSSTIKSSTTSASATIKSKEIKDYLEKLMTTSTKTTSTNN